MGDAEVLRSFSLTRILNEDPITHSIALLGTLPSKIDSSQTDLAIVRIERMGLSIESVAHPLAKTLDKLQIIEQNDIYSWFFAWLAKNEENPDIKISTICPATDVHIRKYSRQSLHMIRETPELYERIVKPFVTAIPPSRIQWVRDILSGKSEAEKVLHRDETGYIILPDMKWDLSNIATLYLVAITTRSDLFTLRDLKREHLPMLKSIRKESYRIVKEKWGLTEGDLRLYVHYQPSYYHFHVHIVNVNYVGLTTSITVGSAHLVEDLISLIELSPPDGPCLLQNMTFTYTLGEQHGLFESMKLAQVEV